MSNATHHFSFDLDIAIFTQLRQALDNSPIRPLEISIGPKESGIYALYYKDALVYVGKASKGTTKSGRTLRSRLNEHVGKISKRDNITLDDMKVRFLTFDSEWWVFAAEYALISREQPVWNDSSFGSKTPGKGRPGTDRISSWDSQFPPK